MMTLTIPPAPAATLARGDRIAAKFLPMYEPADVVFAEAYAGTGGREWVMVVYRYDDGRLDADHFLADARIPLERRADDTGYGYSREVDDPTPVSPARGMLLSGSVVDGDDLVVDGCV
jgi:hypothetical protein